MWPEWAHFQLVDYNFKYLILHRHIPNNAITWHWNLRMICQSALTPLYIFSIRRTANRHGIISHWSARSCPTHPNYCQQFQSLLSTDHVWWSNPSIQVRQVQVSSCRRSGQSTYFRTICDLFLNYIFTCPSLMKREFTT